MQYIILGLLGYALLRVLRSIREAKAENKREAESRKRSEETARMREEFRQQQIESKRIVAEQIRQAKEQEKQARELAKHEEQLMKHEKRIADLEFRMKQAESDIMFYESRLEELGGMLDYILLQQSDATPGSKAHTKLQTKIVSLENQIHATENKRDKAKHIKRMAEKELCA